MVTINNQELKKAFSESTKTQLLEQPTQVDNSRVIPIIDVTPKNYKSCDIVRFKQASNTAAAQTIYTVPSNKDFYLTSCSLSVTKDATSTSIRTYIQVTIDGANQQLLSIAGITLTAQSQGLTMSFPVPIKIDRGTSIQFFNNTAVANIETNASIVGYTVDTM